MTTIAVVTPTLDQRPFIESTLRSVLEGRRPPDEYVVLDGGSTDGTADILAGYANRLTAWERGSDGGQYAAVERGLSRTSSDVMAWLNGDDLYLPWTLSVVDAIFTSHPEVEWVTTRHPLTANERDDVVAAGFVTGFDRDGFRRGANIPGARASAGGIQQESTFWRRSLWERAGARIDTSLRLAGDFELWLRFFEHAELYAVDAPLAAFRVHGGQKTAGGFEAYATEARMVLTAAGGSVGSSAPRRAAYAALGRRRLARLPVALARPLVAGKVLRPVPTIVWSEGRWTVARDYAV